MEEEEEEEEEEDAYPIKRILGRYIEEDKETFSHYLVEWEYERGKGKPSITAAHVDDVETMALALLEACKVKIMIINFCSVFFIQHFTGAFVAHGDSC